MEPDQTEDRNEESRDQAVQETGFAAGVRVLVICAVTAGVLLPKGLPAAIPSGRLQGHGAWRRMLELLPVAILGALTSVTAFGPHPGRPLRPLELLPVAAAIAVAIVWRALRRRRGMHANPTDG